MKEERRWLIYANSDSIFTYNIRKRAEQDLKAFNKDKWDCEEKYRLYKLVVKKIGLKKQR